MANLVIVEPDANAPADQVGAIKQVTLTIAENGTMSVQAAYIPGGSIALSRSGQLVDADLNATARDEIKAIVNRVLKSVKILQQMGFQP